MKRFLAAIFGIAVVLECAAVAADTSGGLISPNAGRGRKTFVEKGCYSCHGYNGQGGLWGPQIAPNPMNLEAMKSFIRNSASTAMPAYSSLLLNDAEAADIHAWLVSQPKTRSPQQIPLLAH